MSIAKRAWLSRAPSVHYRVLSTVQAFREFGLRREQIYAAVEQGKVHAVAMPPRDDRSAEGQTRYPEWELSKLADELGLTPPVPLGINEFKKP